MLLLLDSSQALKVQVLRYRLSTHPEYLESLSERHTLIWLSATQLRKLSKALENTTKDPHKEWSFARCHRPGSRLY